ncbi:hypothetical protein [Streptomyces cyaneofuscatus]|uniref:hypothetical protein n=1 Tax=Streptomyces cyaneofuscatus TaxID=66883 RepID=UPI0037F1813E
MKPIPEHNLTRRNLARQGVSHPFLIPLLCALTLGILGSSCTATEKSYTVPEALCETPISPELLTPLIAPGKELSTVSNNKTQSIRRCRIYVDGKEALSASSEWLNKDKQLRDVAARSYNYVEPNDTVSDDGMYIYSDTGAIGRVICTRPPTASERVFASIRVSDAGRPDAAALSKLIRAYSEALKDSQHCKKQKNWTPEPNRTWQ